MFILPRPPRINTTTTQPLLAQRQDGSTVSNDTITTMIYESAALSAPTVLRASQVTLSPVSATTTARSTPQARLSERELAFAITAGLFGLGILLLVASMVRLIYRHRRARSSEGADKCERGLAAPRNFDDSTWGTRAGLKRSSKSQECTPMETPPSLSTTPHLSLSNVGLASTPSTELTAILEQFEQRLHKEETDIALALHIALGDASDSHCAPFLEGSDGDVTTMLALQAGMECVGKRSGAVRNRVRQGSDASASSQSTTVSAAMFSSSGASNSSLTSIESMGSVMDESGEEEEEDVIYEVKRARTHSMEVQQGRLVSWEGAGMKLLVTEPSSTTLETASSTQTIDLDQFPLPP